MDNSITTKTVKKLSRSSVIAKSSSQVPVPDTSQPGSPSIVCRGCIQADNQRHIIANVNVGWGNAVFLRGEGGSLCWSIGQPMECIGEDKWIWSFPGNDPPRLFKFIRNDKDWALEDNHSPIDAEISAFVPHFPR
jgi:hypothetical protein